MPAITSENVALAIPKFVAAVSLPALVGNLIMGNLVNRDFDAVLAQSGDVVNIPIPPTLVANNLAEGGTVQTQNPNLGNAQIVLDTHAEATFQIPDVTRALAQPDLINLYMMPAVIAIAEKIESDLFANYLLFTANTALGGATAMDEARIDAAETALFDAKMPTSEQKFFVTSSAAFGQMRQIPRFSEYQTVGPTGQPSPIVTGMLPMATNAPNGSANGQIKDFYVYRSQYAPKVSGTTFGMAFGRNALGLVIRRLPMPLPGTGAIAEYSEMGNFGLRVTMSYQPNTLAQQFTIDVLYGTGVLRNQFAVVVKSA